MGCVVAMQQGNGSEAIEEAESPVPTIVFHGDRDTTVIRNEAEAVYRWVRHNLCVPKNLSSLRTICGATSRRSTRNQSRCADVEGGDERHLLRTGSLHPDKELGDAVHLIVVGPVWKCEDRGMQRQLAFAGAVQGILAGILPDIGTASSKAPQGYIIDMRLLLNTKMNSCFER
jgi:hypothetical protein